MQLTISIPTKSQIINGGFVINIAKDGESWSKTQLGEYANYSGVYILHSNGLILYIGKTTHGEYGNFGERLRRHSQKKASNNSDLYKNLFVLKKPVRAYLLDLSDIDMMIDQGPIILSQTRKALIMEQALIGIYEPPHNKI
ncbi:MAG: hypothetical protein L3J53_07360 [Proteobacteria bacterium]|nr:hypothetical protein [Pseudomonadota bacterium]